MRVIGKDNVWAIGDCGVVPNAFDGKPSPTLAQFAIRQARQLAQNMSPPHCGAADAALPLPHARVVRGDRAAQCRGPGDGFTFAGFFAWFLWRGIYLSKMPTFARKVEIAFDWAWDLLFPRDICELSPRETPRIPRVSFSARRRNLPPGRAGQRSSTSSKKGRRACSLAAGRNRSCTSVRANSSGKRELVRERRAQLLRQGGRTARRADDRIWPVSRVPAPSAERCGRNSTMRIVRTRFADRAARRPAETSGAGAGESLRRDGQSRRRRLPSRAISRRRSPIFRRKNGRRSSSSTTAAACRGFAP